MMVAVVALAMAALLLAMAALLERVGEGAAALLGWSPLLWWRTCVRARRPRSPRHRTLSRSATRGCALRCRAGDLSLAATNSFRCPSSACAAAAAAASACCLALITLTSSLEDDAGDG
eukprot:CAMPEP_0171750578 /NCGR_PEP_ID=MMETSP0991-20121206/41472_1 /TAXON_ID=483369 /ORGANISM="non described non described, Strain CCMP2098" /LENGTH=117 /DNA_ID=CAMNT_0012351533 /DNA_START=245 /DNA_END=595 /DNA_ORIENTATION=+